MDEEVSPAQSASVVNLELRMIWLLGGLRHKLLAVLTFGFPYSRTFKPSSIGNRLHNVRFALSFPPKRRSRSLNLDVFWPSSPFSQCDRPRNVKKTALTPGLFGFPGLFDPVLSDFELGAFHHSAAFVQMVTYVGHTKRTAGCVRRYQWTPHPAMQETKFCSRFLCPILFQNSKNKGLILSICWRTYENPVSPGFQDLPQALSQRMWQ